jgi:hypothetical protein
MVRDRRPHADRWGELVNRGQGLTVTARIPTSLAEQLHCHAGKLGGVGPGYYADGDNLVSLNRGTGRGRVGSLAHER